jgi:signal transduction histidine kinase
LTVNQLRNNSAQTAVCFIDPLLRLTGLCSVWSELLFLRLSLQLGRLLSPFREKDPFTIRLESDEFPEYSGELRSDILTQAPYRIEALFDGDQTITLSTNRTGAARQRWNGHGELACGPVRVRLFVFDLDGEALARIGPRMEVRAWLKEWTGVSIYRDGFRVWPYGEPHDDWLRLDQRRVNNPVEHLSNNQVIGFIDISRNRNPDLMDQTNREGLMHNKAFEDLRRLVYFVLQLVEAERQAVRHPVQRRQAVPDGPGSEPVSAELERLAEQARGGLARDLRQLGRQLAAQRLRDHAREEQLVNGYAELAAVGQLAAGLAQIVPAQLADLQASLDACRRTLANATDPAATPPLDALAGAVDRIAEQLRMLQLGAGANDRRRTIDLTAETRAFRDLVEPLLQRHEVRMELEHPAKEVLRAEMRPEHFHCLLQILTANALDWLREADVRRIRVAVSGEKGHCEVVFNDSGPGIPEGFAQRVFEAGFSLKEGGRGMGLTIARRLVVAHGGRIEVMVDGRRKGANLRLVLPRKRSRATFYNGR